MKSTCQLWPFWKSGWITHGCFIGQSPSSLMKLIKEPCLIRYRLYADRSRLREYELLQIKYTWYWFLTWVLPAMEHLEPSSKELPKSSAESAILELGALHKLKWSCIWQFGECSRTNRLLFSTGCITWSTTAEATKSHTFPNPPDYNMSRDWNGPQQRSRWRVSQHITLPDALC